MNNSKKKEKKDIFPEVWRLMFCFGNGSIALSPPLSAYSFESDPVSDSSRSRGN